MDEAVKITLAGDSEVKFKRYTQDRLQSLKDGLREIHETNLPRWRKAYEAIPLEKTRSSPFQNASNIVVPIVAIHTNTLLARVMAAVFKTSPFWVVKAVGGDPSGQEADECRIALEEHLGYIGIEPSELDLYRVYEDFFGDVIQYGTSVVKSIWKTDYEDQVLPGSGIRGGSSTGSDSVRVTVYDGPRPEKLAFEDFFIPPQSKTIETADFKAHCKHLQRHELEERRALRVYDPKAVTEVLKSPDRTSPRSTVSQQESDTGAKTLAGYGYAEWDIYECWFTYRVGDKKYKAIAAYHLATNTLLRAVYSNYPAEPFVSARLFLRKDSWYGYGFAEMLGMFQEEISTQHNQRQDAKSVANANFARVNPDSKLHEGYAIFPSALVPAEEGEIEMMKFGEPSAISIDDERLSLELAERLSGVSPPLQAQGAGSVTKKGSYSAMGTLSLLQEGNNRTDLNISDLRYAHSKIGRLISRQIATMGLSSERFEMFGSRAELIVKAYQLLKRSKLVLPITAATASVNREVEKQNDLLLSNLMMRHYNTITQMLQGLSSGMLKPEVGLYITETIKAANLLMNEVLRHFGYDEPQRYVPQPQLEQPGGQGGQGQPGQGQGQPGGPGGQPGAGGALANLLSAANSMAPPGGDSNLLQMGGIPTPPR